MILSSIVAVAHNGVIGNNNQLIWHISEDLKYFKATTINHTIIMGRKSYESIGKALPNRRNIIVTRNLDFVAPGCEVVNSLEDAIALCREEDEVFISGGGEIYRASLPMCDRLYITEISQVYEGSTTFPEIDKTLWMEVSREDFDRGVKYEHPFSFVVYDRVKTE